VRLKDRTLVMPPPVKNLTPRSSKNKKKRKSKGKNKTKKKSNKKF